jgi:transmembrane sensor
MIDKQLFDRFLKNECTADERRQVFDYLEAHPGEAEKLLSENEFSQVQPEDWNPRRSAQSFDQVSRRIQKDTRPILRWSLVAAATALIAVVGIKWLTTRPAGHSAIAPPVANTRPQQAIDAWITAANTTKTTQLFVLPDSSSAELSPGSRISYLRTMTTDDQRLIKLTGEGQFNVTTNPSHPFKVVSGELTTTVLGTWFSVTADPDSSTIKIHLYNGKVQVGATRGFSWKSKDSTMLLQPGDELTYNKQSLLASIRTPHHTNHQQIAKLPTAPLTTTHPHPLTASAKPEWYRFGGQSLTEVFDQLSDYYGVQINYFPSDVANHFFTGKFQNTDSLEDILNDIALLHDLTLTKQQGMYIFRKKDH